jgi:hypothetical protein
MLMDAEWPTTRIIIAAMKNWKWTLLQYVLNSNAGRHLPKQQLSTPSRI